MCNIPECDQICRNCAPWDEKHIMKIPVWRNPYAVEPSHDLELAPCKANAVEPNAGACVPMMGRYGDCLQHAQAFEPCEEYLEGLRKRDSLDAERVFAQPYEVPRRRQQSLQEAV